ncbi:GD10571 [Drosophila simulans]|uniref:GD10571 n=1 Tax=Drosophila simulans TaxID=7240 RepID=B4QFT3_DROSI|nr:GD10571 [Drosophila simulans]
MAHESIRFDGKNGSIKSTPLAKEQGRGRGMAHGQPLSQSAGVQTKSVGNICWHPNYINAAPTETKAMAKEQARTTHPAAQMSESQVSMADNSRKPKKFAFSQSWLLRKDARCICREFPINFNLGKNRMMSAVILRTADTQKTSDKDTGDRNDDEDDD